MQHSLALLRIEPGEQARGRVVGTCSRNAAGKRGGGT